VIEPEAPTAVVVDDRSALDVGATAVAVPVWPGANDAGPGVGEGAADLLVLGVDLFGALERAKASGRAGQVVSVPVSGEGGIVRALCSWGSATAPPRCTAARVLRSRGRRGG
jgi:hypothetical protein